MKLFKNLFLSLLAFCSMTLWAAVNVNTATAEELQKLNGIGVKKAEAIVAYREANGPFATAEDLLKVKGIGEGILNKIRADIEFGTETTPAETVKSADESSSESKPTEKKSKENSKQKTEAPKTEDAEKSKNN